MSADGPANPGTSASVAGVVFALFVRDNPDSAYRKEG